MDAFMKKIERLSELATSQSVPLPLDRRAIMARIHGLAVEEDDQVLSLPLRFWATAAATAAAAAIAVSVFAATAWTEMGSPTTAVESLFDIMEVL
jgi:hypothetical protein